jgi:hypothetical protein
MLANVYQAWNRVLCNASVKEASNDKMIGDRGTDERLIIDRRSVMVHNELDW